MLTAKEQAELDRDPDYVLGYVAAAVSSALKEINSRGRVSKKSLRGILGDAERKFCAYQVARGWKENP